MKMPSIEDCGPVLIGTGLAVVLAAQLWPGIPIAAAIALIGCGATYVSHKAATAGLADSLRHQRWRLCGSLLVYGALVGLAVGAELDLRFNTIFVADALLALLLLLSAVQSVFHRTDSSSTW
ncbi:hypothetical protein [Bythopirellula goksoeyrii]|uniref:Uncharacterized protein n=1 Tax=Bythopirellula goksoeyrii TaxID=1400387 RepID=A0A5B9QK36_9BACT|nr:hypothetical protein [Bythopirellula goksoeyrii]QEG37950.1 hypothetical protein Pr1d_52980 [Bythopirellula goksoeyrii]